MTADGFHRWRGLHGQMFWRCHGWPSSFDYVFMDYVFMDPPYTDFPLLPALRGVMRQGYIGPQTLVIVEQPKIRDPEALESLFSVLDDRRYGASRVLFLATLPVPSPT